MIRQFQVLSGTRDYGWCGGFRVGLYFGRDEAEALAAFNNDPNVPARYFGRVEVHEVAL